MPLAFGNTEIVRRSNAILEYNDCINYEEANVYPNFFEGFIETLTPILLITIIFIDPLFYILRKCYFKKPGEGPSVKV